MRRETKNFGQRWPWTAPLESSFVFSIFRPLKLIAFSPIVLLLSIYLAVLYGYLYLLFTTFPRVFEAQYGFSSQTVGLTYIGIGVGALIGLAATGMVSDKLVAQLTQSMVENRSQSTAYHP